MKIILINALNVFLMLNLIMKVYVNAILILLEDIMNGAINVMMNPMEIQDVLLKKVAIIIVQMLN